MWRYRYINIKLLRYPLAVGMVLLVIFLLSKPNMPVAYLPQRENIPGKLHYIVQTDFSGLPPKADVYQIKNDQLNEKEVKKIARHFKINGDITYDKANKEWLVYKNNQLLIAKERDGRWIYRYFTHQSNTNYEHAFPTDEEIMQIVTEKLSPLGISKDEFAATTVGSTIEDERVVQKSVYFYRQINNCPIWGEAQLVIDIDGQGQLVGLTNAHWPLQPLGKYKLKSITEAVAQMENNQALYDFPTSIIGEPVIYETELAYYRFSDQSLKPSRYLQPVYLFSGEVETGTGIVSFKVLVPAVKGVTLQYINGSN